MVSAALKDLPHPIHPAAYKTANRGRSGYEVSTKLFPAVPSPATYLHDRGFGPGNRTVLCLSAESRNICGRTTSFLDRDSPPRSKGLQTNPFSDGCFPAELKALSRPTITAPVSRRYDVWYRLIVKHNTQALSNVLSAIQFYGSSALPLSREKLFGSCLESKLRMIWSASR
jgi:hypothetical protein